MEIKERSVREAEVFHRIAFENLTNTQARKSTEKLNLFASHGNLEID